MSKMLNEISVLPRGTITERDPVTGLLTVYVYQRVNTKFGNVGSDGVYGLQRRRHVIPFDPRTQKQITQRNKLSQAVQSWKALPINDKDHYRKLADSSGLTGYQFYVKQFLLGLTN